jgi:hypothetical protein
MNINDPFSSAYEKPTQRIGVPQPTFLNKLEFLNLLFLNKLEFLNLISINKLEFLSLLFLDK